MSQKRNNFIFLKQNSNIMKYVSKNKKSVKYFLKDFNLFK